MPDTLEKGGLDLFCHLIGAIFGETGGGLIGGQTTFGMTVLETHLADGLVDREGVPWLGFR